MYMDTIALEDIYAQNHLRGNLISEKVTQPVEEAEDEEDTVEEAKKSFKKNKGKKAKKDEGKKKKGDSGWTPDMYNDSKSFDNIFGRLIREMGEMGDEEGGDDFTYDGSGGGDDDFGGDEEGDVSVPKSVLRDLIDQLQGLLGENDGDFDDEGGDEFGSDDFGDDQIPAESVERTGGNYHGDQGDYNGKAKVQGKTTHVKGNGDAKSTESNKTGYEPEDTEGSEGSEHGDQGDYNGKAKVQPKSDKVKPNGDAKVGMTNATGYRTGTGKGKNKF